MRLIDADAFEKWAWSNPDVVVDGDGYVLPYAASNFAEEHTIDAVPVVRCSECVLSRSCTQEDIFRLVAGIENPFCCVGKRKDGEG